MYRDAAVAHGLPAATPWDIGGPQPVVQQLVALGAIKGEVLDPGTGPGHHAIYYASKGYSATGIDGSETRARAGPGQCPQCRGNGELPAGRRDEARRSGQPLRHGGGLRLLPHLFDDRELQTSYARALHRATKPGARLFMFEFGIGNINGFYMPRSLSEDDFRTVFPTPVGRSPIWGRRPTRST